MGELYGEYLSEAISNKYDYEIKSPLIYTMSW